MHQSDKNAAVLQAKRVNSKLVYDGDPGDQNGAQGATEKKYLENTYDPATEVGKFSYTSGRVAKRVYNGYAANETKIVGYYTDWSQYDGRYEYKFADSECGRGIDLMLLDPTAYDKLVIGFVGIIGDVGEKQQTINNAASHFGRNNDEATFVDAWGDVASSRNCGFAGWVSDDYRALFDEKTAQGVLGGLRKLKEKNPELELSFSVGGWTMSEAFHWVAASSFRRETLINSILDIFKRFPMFEAIDLDWEYPGAEGNVGNTYDDSDAQNFQALVRELRRALDESRLTNVQISIAAAAAVKKLEKADIKGMLDAGVDGINLMTYDFFGTPWAPVLAHHTNLHQNGPDGPDTFSVDAAVDYLERIGVPLERVVIGYAGYSRSARNAEITNWSPLTGTYSPGTGTTTGSFESGVTEWYDLIYNYLDLENQTGVNGFNVYTDQVADADYLYNPETKLFMSIDTPRTVKAKGEYVVRRGLGGLVTWTIELDNGVLVNAAREGLGNQLVTQRIDMAPFYFEGVNVTGNNRPPIASIEGPLNAFEGDLVKFSGAGSRDPNGDTLTYLWSARGLPFDGATGVEVEGVSPVMGESTSYIVALTVDDGTGLSNTTSVNLKVSPVSSVQAKISGNTTVTSGDVLSLSGAGSTGPEPLTYKWSAPGLPFDGSAKVSVSATAPAVSQNTAYPVELTVTGAAANGVPSVASAMVQVLMRENTGTWEPKAYPGGSEVTHNYKGNGMHSYRARFYVEPSQEPGDPAWTTTQPDGNAMPWLDLGPATA